MNKNSKIYVAGHRGLVGSAIVRELKRQGYCNLIYKTHSELDLWQQNQVESFFETEKPEYVFLVAAKVGGIIAINTYPAEFIKRVVGFEGEIIWDSSKPDGAPRKLLNVKKINKLGWKAGIKLEKGLIITYQWFKNNQAKAKII